MRGVLERLAVASASGVGSRDGEAVARGLVAAPASSRARVDREVRESELGLAEEDEVVEARRGDARSVARRDVFVGGDVDLVGVVRVRDREHRDRRPAPRERVAVDLVEGPGEAGEVEGDAEADRGGAERDAPRLGDARDAPHVTALRARGDRAAADAPVPRRVGVGLARHEKRAEEPRGRGGERGGDVVRARVELEDVPERRRALVARARPGAAATGAEGTRGGKGSGALVRASARAHALARRRAERRAPHRAKKAPKAPRRRRAPRTSAPAGRAAAHRISSEKKHSAANSNGRGERFRRFGRGEKSQRFTSTARRDRRLCHKNVDSGLSRSLASLSPRAASPMCYRTTCPTCSKPTWGG